MIRTIPLNKLLPSPRNVRRATDEQADLQLKADIEARGLLQNLVVAPAKKPKGRFTVEAGGRRLAALTSLAEEGKLPTTHEVCCLVLDGGPAAAQEASLAENFQRLSMNPADECLAFRQLIEQGADVHGIARRFGLTVRFVEGRLRLSSLAPIVFEALGRGEITLDVAKAYAATPDQERQAYVFEQLNGSYSGGSPDSIRRMMTQATVSATDRRARLVGEDAYVAAGGRIERDLFSEETGERWLDIALLERLAGEKMETLAAETAAQTGLAWVRPTLDSWIGYNLTMGLQRVVPEREPLSDEERERIETAQAEVEQLVALVEDEEIADEAREDAAARVEALEQEIERIADKPPLIDEALKPTLGAFLMLDPDGRPQLDSFFYSEAQPEAEPEQGEGPGPADLATAGGGGSTSETEDPVDAPRPLPRTLVDELAIQRRDILAVHVSANPGLALDLLIFLMIDREAGYSSEKSGSSLAALPPSDPVFGFKTPDAAATLARAQAADALDRSWTSRGRRAARFDSFRSLPDEARAAWLGHAVARTLEASANSGSDRVCAFHDHLGSLLGIEVEKWWRPTGANFFDRVPKAAILSALEEVGGPTFAARYAKGKKAELSQSAERIFAGDFIGDVEVKERALAWVPEAMRFVPEPAADPVEETPPWEDEPADQPIGYGEDVVVTEVPTSGLVDQPDDPQSGGDPKREGGAEDAPAAQQEEVDEAA